MTSSTSSSDPRPPEAGAGGSGARLRRWVATFAAVFGGGIVLLYATLILIDPFDSGRFPSLGLRGVSDRNLRTSHVSRGRDPQFDSAIFGNSTGQAIDPAILSARTGLRFTQLTFTQAGPREVLSVLGWFVAHHRSVGAVVLVADDLWCSGDAKMPQRYPFPGWLYGGDFEYLAHVLNWKSLDRVIWRLQLALGRRKPNDQVGFFGYFEQHFYYASPTIPPDLTPAEANADFVWIDRLRHTLADFAPDGTLSQASLVVVAPPVYVDYLPPEGSRRAGRVARCKAALAAVAARTARGALVDRRIDTPDVRSEDNFFDRIHYRPPLARSIEDAIVATLAGDVPGRTHDALKQ